MQCKFMNIHFFLLFVQMKTSWFKLKTAVTASTLTAQTEVSWKQPALTRAERVRMVCRSFPKETTLAANLSEGAGILVNKIMKGCSTHICGYAGLM